MVSFTTRLLFPRARDTGIHLMRGRVGHTAGFHTLEYRKSLGLSGTEPRFLGRPTWLLMCMFGARLQLCKHIRKLTNKMQLCRIIYYSLAALHVSSDIFAHLQENLNCITASGITHICRCQLVATYV